MRRDWSGSVRPTRERPHAMPDWSRWRRADQGKNTYTSQGIYTIRGPLYRKESWKRVLGTWPPGE